MLKLGDNNISSIKLGSTNVKSVYQGDTLIWPTEEYATLVYTTTSDREGILLTYTKLSFEYIETEDGIEDLSGSGMLSHTFVNAGEHKVKILFKKGVTNFSRCFLNCTALTSIPSNLFANSPEATTFFMCFYGCTGLTSIPSDLFANNTKVNNFTSCFYGCTGLTSIPSDLFANNTKVNNFNACFVGCTALTSIPSNLFANNHEVIDFGSCFGSCTALTSSTPLDNDGTPMYNRSRGKEGYSVVTRYNSCFYKCYLMSDYNSIPSDWK